MNFPKLFHKSNSSIHQLQGNVLDCSIEQIRGNKVIVNTGMRTSFVCFRDELCEPSAMAGFAGYKFFCKGYNDNQNGRLLLNKIKKQPSCKEEIKKQGSIEGPILSQSVPFYWGAPWHSMPQGPCCGRLTDELTATAIHESFVPFLTTKQNLPRLFQNSSTEGRNNLSKPKARGLWASLRSALLLSLHSPAQNDFMGESSSRQRLEHPKNGGLRIPRRLTSVGTPGYSRPRGDGERRAWVHENSIDPEQYSKSGERIRSMRILGSRQPKALRCSPGDSQNQAVPLYAGVPSIIVSPNVLLGVDKGTTKGVSFSLDGGGFPVRPAETKEPQIVRLVDLKVETSYFGRPCIIGVEEKRSPLSGELICSSPKSMEKISRRKLVWTELTNLWRSNAQNRMKARLRLGGSLPGFILNSVNGGYAVAIAGYIAFMPKSLCLNKKVFIGQWRQFAIIGMNPKITNIVVKEIRANLSTPVKNKAKVQRMRRRRISAN